MQNFQRWTIATLFKWQKKELDFERFCCDRKARAACAQSFALWQQATILYHCLFAPLISGVVLRAHPVRGESHIQRNANREAATVQ